jgi:4-hydroxy-3-methylbut-2-enyl diphosphate reductase
MRLSLAVTAGFCMGVRRAMELALISCNKSEPPIYSYGPLIHNPQVMQLLQKRGIRVLEEIPPPQTMRGGTVIIRAHGVPPQTKARLKAAGFSQIIDATCSRVIRVQQIIAQSALRGASIVIAGDADHPEVAGLLAHARTHGLSQTVKKILGGQGRLKSKNSRRARPVSLRRKLLRPKPDRRLGRNRGYVVGSPAETACLPASLRNLVAVAQTTQNQENFQQVCAALQKRFGEVRVYQTICAATRKRQDEVIKMAREVDAVVVVGGRQSANSLRLADLAAQNGALAFLVENEDEIPGKQLAGLDNIGVTAGASTPNWMIRRIIRRLKDLPGRQPASRLRRASHAWAVFLLRSQAALGLGAAALTLAAMRMQGLNPAWLPPSAAFCFVLTMHLSNHLWRRQTDQYNDPEQSVFLRRHLKILWSVAGASAAGALLLSFLAGWPSFFCLLSMTGLGVIYSLPRQGVTARLRSLPGSKTINTVLAWGAVCALLPALPEYNGQVLPLPSLLYVMALMFIRNSLADLRNMQGDLFMGQETIPIILGPRYTRALLSLLSLALLLGLAAAPLCLAGWPALLSLALFAPVLALNLWQRLLPQQALFLTSRQWLWLEMSLWLGAACLLV